MTSTQSNVVNLPVGSNRLSFLDQLESDLSFNDYWQALVKAAETEFEANKGKKNKFDIIATADKRGTYFANPAHLRVKEGFNFRNFNSPKGIESIKRMALEIIGEGAITEPLKIFNEGNDPTFWIENGHRRFTGLKYAIVHHDFQPEGLRIPVRMGEKSANDVDRKFSQIRDNSGEKPSPLEMARIFADMMKMGGKEDVLAKRAGISKSRVISLLDMASMPAALQSYSEHTDIEIADSFLHNLYRAVDRDGDRALTDLETAIRRATEQGYDRVMPKHLPPETYALYKGDTGKVPSAKGSKPVLAPVPSAPAPEAETPRPTQASQPDTSATVEDTKDDAPVDDVRRTVEADDAGATPDPVRASNDKGSDNQTSATPPKSTKSQELPVRPSTHNQRPDNLTFRAAVTHFFKYVAQFSPINPDEPDAPRTITLLKNELDNETTSAILHSLNLD